MALFYRKLVRDSIRAILTAGFNSTMRDAAIAYSTDPIVIDFNDGSLNFAVSSVNPGDPEKTQFQSFPAACVYTSDALADGDVHTIRFSGKVMAHVDFYVRDRNGAEGTNTEDYFDAIEDAAVTLLNDRNNQWPGSAQFTRTIKMQRQPLVPLGDGFGTRIPITMVFEVQIL